MSAEPKTFPCRVSVCELGLGDVVRISDAGPFLCGVVRKVTDIEVIVFRPYAITADFSYTGGVIPYIGVEEISYPRNSHTTMFVWKPGDVK